jgi:antitoxin YefM
MAIRTSYAAARANFAKLCERVVAKGDVVIIHRAGGEDVALVSASELNGIAETAHLLRSPRNRDRLLGALKDARQGRGKPQSVSKLKASLGWKNHG